MLSAGEFLMLFIGIELATIPTAILAAYEVKKLKSVNIAKLGMGNPLGISSIDL